MEKREKNIPIKLFVNNEEYETIQNNMIVTGINNFSLFL